MRTLVLAILLLYVLLGVVVAPIALVFTWAALQYLTWARLLPYLVLSAATGVGLALPGLLIFGEQIAATSGVRNLDAPSNTHDVVIFGLLVAILPSASAALALWRRRSA